MTQCWRLDTPAQTLVLASREDRLAEIVYWSGPLDEGEELSALVDLMSPSPAGGVLDRVAPLSICPNARDGFTGMPGLELRGADGAAVHPAFRLVEASPRPNALTLIFADPDLGVRYTFTARAYPGSDMLVLEAALHQGGAGDLRIGWLSAPVVPASPQVGEVVEFSGRWCGEFQMNKSPLTPGARLRENRLGRSSHEHFPGILLPTAGATETGGEVFALSLGHSAGHRHLLETLPDGRTQVQFGLTPGQHLPHEAKSGPLYLTRSGAGFNGISHAFHRHIRKQLVTFADPERPRPVHYNCWEAIYFDHDPARLMQLADQAVDLGVERFVLDDGWFGKRDDDSSSLGDWVVDRRKWPDGLTPLIDHVKARGMTFGLWFEPEMVNLDSDLARAHPDWILGPGDQVTGRGQHVLDIAKPEVADYLFDAIDAILSEYDIDYIKWDHNRVLPYPDPGQAEALYRLLARLRTAHPGVEIESCASGGGRIDLGILAHTQRVWLSDSNDALERLKMQRGASYFLPPEIVGSHVGPRVCHTSGRIFAMGFRAAVAGTRAFGLEMDLAELQDAERETLKAAIAAFKARRHILHKGRCHRLETRDPQVLAEIFVNHQKRNFVLFAGQLGPSDQTLSMPLRLTGLDPDARYRLKLENPGDVAYGQNRLPRRPFQAGRHVEMSGALLMQAGVQLPNALPNTLWTVTGKKI
ncbi:alpha-galactosidase [Oceanibium sediminis]|uniref:alpha-galactosidase n=1 Tax=Oceanibium sediminis TaxID=2026339 RepID=UPI000DD2EF74|nr:alpha-galactosidase [Oceanibium sediminis]